MAKNKQKKDFLLKCPVCRGSYSNSDIWIVLKQKDKIVFHLTCPICFSKSLNILSTTSAGALGFGMLTDLDREEIKKISEVETVSADEVIDIYSSVAGRQEYFWQGL